MPAGELHIQLSVNFPDNRKVRALIRYGREARATRDLYTQMLLYCKETKSDGFVPEEQVGLLAYPDGETIGKRQAGYLVDVGLCSRAADGYMVTGWLERNPSRAAIERKSHAKSRGARLANHRRWHAETETPDPNCEWCQKEDQTTDQIIDRSSDQNTDQNSDPTSDSDRLSVLKRSDSTETESESEAETQSEAEVVKPLDRQEPAGKRIESGSDDDPDFCAFWDVYPRREAKGQARKAWKTATVKRGIEPKVIILGAERYRDDPRRQSQDIKFTAHPGTWLNGERWLEQNDPQPEGPRRIEYPTSPWAQ